MLPTQITGLVWPLMIGGIVYAAAAAKAQSAFAPMVFAGMGAYAVRKAMDQDKDLVSFGVLGSKDWIPF